MFVRMNSSSLERPKTAPRLRWTVVALMGAVLLPSCSVMRKVERMVPEIPPIVLIGGEKKVEVTPNDPSTLIPDQKKDAAVFKFRSRGQTQRVVIRLFPDAAPMTVANFQEKVRSRTYDGMAIHRTIPNYLVQMGDPQSKNPGSRAAWGTGGWEATVPAEIQRPHRLGAVGMARLGDDLNSSRDSSESQFYIALGDLSSLDGRYTVFGQVIEGYDALQTLSETPTDENDNPYERLEIVSAHLSEAEHHEAENPEILQRNVQRRSLEEAPPATEGFLKRRWRQIW